MFCKTVVSTWFSCFPPASLDKSSAIISQSQSAMITDLFVIPPCCQLNHFDLASVLALDFNEFPASRLVKTKQMSEFLLHIYSFFHLSPWYDFQFLVYRTAVKLLFSSPSLFHPHYLEWKPVSALLFACFRLHFLARHLPQSDLLSSIAKDFLAPRKWFYLECLFCKTVVSTYFLAHDCAFWHYEWEVVASV